MLINKKWMTTGNVAVALGLDVVTVRMKAHSGEIPSFKLGGKFRFVASDINHLAWRIKAGLVPEWNALSSGPKQDT